MSADRMFESEQAADGDAPDGPLHFDCPRCREATAATYWGPCESCRTAMADASRRDGRDVEIGAYEPKMNVVPNQVATKD